MCKMVFQKQYLLLLVCFITTIESAKILCLTACGPRSHYNVFIPFVEALASRGHEITIVSQFQTLKHPNIKEIYVDSPTKLQAAVSGNFFDTLANRRDLILRSFLPFWSDFCDLFSKEEVLQQFLKAGKVYDLVVVSGVLHECIMWLPPLVGKHTIYLNPTGHVPWEYASVPLPPSYVPMVILPYKSSMNFLERLWNSWIQVENRLYYQFVMVPTIQQVVHSNFPQAPTIEEGRQRVALTLSNADPVLYSPRPGAPDYILVGAMHCRPAKQLPEKFMNIIKKANGHGVVVFSLGSVAPSKELPEKIRMAFIAAFARLKQLVIWKYEDESIPNHPPNVVITPWLPLQDLLGNNETRLFITHGGLLSSQEAVYHGVPTVGIPLFYDQVGNVARMEELGIGRGLQFGNLTEEAIYDAIQGILNDDSYHTNMRKYSSILRDQPQTPTDRAVYWAEYVIRHNGASHLKSPATELSFAQYFLLDVVSAIVLAVLSVVVVTICVGRCVIRSCLKPKKTKLS